MFPKMAVSHSHVQTAKSEDKPPAASLTLLSERKKIAKQSFIDKYPAAIVTYDKLQAPTPADCCSRAAVTEDVGSIDWQRFHER